MRKLILLVIIICSALLFAETDYEKWKAQEENKFSSYVSEQDKQFKGFLEKDWEDYNTFDGEKFDIGPKRKSGFRSRQWRL